MPPGLPGTGGIDFIEINDYTWLMQHGQRQASITIRSLDPVLKERLRVRAAQHGVSMEAEVRRILQTVLSPQNSPAVQHLYDRVRARFAAVGGVDLELPAREFTREPPQFD